MDQTSPSNQAQEQLFQKKPPYALPSQFKPKGWTSTVKGYIYEANKLSRLILLNKKYLGRDYPWKITIKVEVVLSPGQVNDLWKKACRVLRDKGVVALWVREPHRDNTVHYHLIVSSHAGQKRKLEKAVEEAMPHRSVVPYHKQVKAIRSQWHWAHYVSKAKLPGFARGRPVPDKYGRKRLLFKPRLGLQKSREIGSFWVKPNTALWNEIVATEKRIADGLADERVRDLAAHVHKMLGETVALALIERSMGYSADTPTVQNWINSLSGLVDGDHWAVVDSLERRHE